MAERFLRTAEQQQSAASSGASSSAAAAAANNPILRRSMMNSNSTPPTASGGNSSNNNNNNNNNNTSQPRTYHSNATLHDYTVRLSGDGGRTATTTATTPTVSPAKASRTAAATTATTTSRKSTTANTINFNFAASPLSSQETQQTSNLRRRCQNILPIWCYSYRSFVRYNQRMIKTRIWKFLMVIFSLFLLFGSSIQHLLRMPPTSELVFDILSCITLGFFIVDIILRILVEPDYFHLKVCGLVNHNRGFGAYNAATDMYGGGGGGVMNDSQFTGKECAIGSFLFWCDLISTGMLLYDISFIHPRHYEVVQVNIQLNHTTGLPESGFDEFNRLRPVNMELILLVTIGRCARVARFVRSRTVVNASNKINWYWIVNILQKINPIQYWRKFIKRRQQQRLNSLGIAEDSGSFVQTASTSTGGGGTGGGSDDKRTSWGVLQIGIMAAVHAQAEAEAREARGNVVSRLKRYLRSMGVLESQSALAARHAAAIKIQRAWRAHLRTFEPTASNDGGSTFGDFAVGADTYDEISLTGKGSHHSMTSAERVIRKRSALRAFASLNHRSGGRRLDRKEIRASLSGGSRPAQESRFQSQAGTGRESQVGSDMRELTGQRVAMGILLSLVFTVVFTYEEMNSTPPTAMVLLHNQTQYPNFRDEALYGAVTTSVPDLYKFVTLIDGDEVIVFEDDGDDNNNNKRYGDDLRDRDKLKVTVIDTQNSVTSIGWFSFRQERVRSAITEIVATSFVIIVWFFGVTAFAGPVMSLVVVPIERMVRLLGMLMLDPLGYQATARFKKFIIEEDALIKNTRWTKEVLKGMETSFLMSTINRIGSLLKVGFGSAGVEIIRNNLQKGQSKNMLILNSQGSTVSCIFLFCDIRQFTDATECLQEEVFVFTNKIAAVVHSICHSYGGAANKNVGDAFLLSWSLEDGESNKSTREQRGSYSGERSKPLKAKANQADKALLSVIKICIALYYDKYYLEPLSDAARNRLTNKLMKRTGPVVQMGFGLHAGKAVQGAIGSQRKIDATYVSESVERAEFLESSTKRYGLKMLMSGDFHRLLHPNTRRRCRKIDQILLQDDDGDYDEDESDEIQGEIMSVYTFDMDVEAIHRPPAKQQSRLDNDAFSDAGSISNDTPTSRSGRTKRSSRNSRRNMRRRRVSRSHVNDSEELYLSGRESNSRIEHINLVKSPSISGASVSSVHSGDESNTQDFQGPPELVLPTGPALYSHNVWQSPDMKRIRDKFVQSLFFQKFNAGLQAFYGRDWDLARQCFQTVLENFDDGPSKYFMKQIKAHKGVPPKDFKEYGLA